MMYFCANDAGIKVRAITTYYSDGSKGLTFIQNGSGGFAVDAGTVVTLTGWYFLNQDYACFYIVEYPGYYIYNHNWSIIEGTIQPKTQAQAQSLINRLLKNNQIIFENNLLLARFANKLNSSEKQNLYYLQKRLEQRDNMLREADVFSQMQEARIMGYSNYENNLVQFMTSYQQGVGVVISTTTAIIIAVVVIGSLSTAAYFAFKALYEESVKDVELSKKMLQTLAKYNISEEDMRIIEQETQGIVTKAVLMEKINTTFGNIKNILLYGALGYVGYQLYKKYKK